MLKKSALDYFGGVTATAKVLGISKSTVSTWRTVVPWKYALLIEKLTDGKLKYTPSNYENSLFKNAK
ncbi:Cro/Cl family transcriptional regulator [Xenorhabdus bovienii]|uniref:Cro/CI family transcriptional regulator n=1 Tax=Xenorhabdus bovienii TaxID=40576 RepID=UPI0004D81A91|nr:Cro/CI family transcriptional regulator [Xenorhabdus bovienii]MDE9565478.1 Cro/Cl family transcriptional regulator [Xenorhabdus bovienii]CDG86545.1 Regulatory protein cro [Xenorhabdus bovienii str. feltiae France]CDG94214.1 Regulatory protein cro [Xenorhabdus bovienii str. feltiae Florida]